MTKPAPLPAIGPGRIVSQAVVNVMVIETDDGRAELITSAGVHAFDNCRAERIADRMVELWTLIEHGRRPTGSAAAPWPDRPAATEWMATKIRDSFIPNAAAEILGEPPEAATADQETARLRSLVYAIRAVAARFGKVNEADLMRLIDEHKPKPRPKHRDARADFPPA